MERKSKRILFVTDDFRQFGLDSIKRNIEKGDFYYADNWLTFTLTFIDDLEQWGGASYDAVLMDYGMIGEKKRNLKIMENIYKACDKRLIWVGGFGDYVLTDIQENYPNIEWMQGHRCSTTAIDEILGMLYYVFKDQAPPREVRKG